MDANVVYSIRCLSCKEDNIDKMKEIGQYRGQTGRTMHSRMKEHEAGLGAKKMSCPLYRHQLDRHKDNIPRFEMEKVKKTSSNIERLILEAEVISKDQDDGWKNWNSKSEYGKSKLIRWRPDMSYV